MKKILVVDDHLPLRELIEVALSGEGRRILHAASGEEALALARIEIPHLVLLDIMMPGGMDGYEVARLLRSDEATRHCLILAVTARTQQLDRHQAQQVGVDGYLTKPFTLSELRSTVSPLLGE